MLAKTHFDWAHATNTSITRFELALVVDELIETDPQLHSKSKAHLTLCPCQSLHLMHLTQSHANPYWADNWRWRASTGCDVSIYELLISSPARIDRFA